MKIRKIPQTYLYFHVLTGIINDRVLYYFVFIMKYNLNGSYFKYYRNNSKYLISFLVV